jgi:hypothetical protein
VAEEVVALENFISNYCTTSLSTNDWYYNGYDCALLLANLLLHAYEADFLPSLLKNEDRELSQTFNSRFTDVTYLFYIILSEQVLFYSIFNINRFLRLSLMSYVILCGSNRKKAFKSVISPSNFFHKTFEEAKGGNHNS